MEKLELYSREANFDKMDSFKEEQVGSPVKLEFSPCIVEISSSSEKSCTGQAQEIGEDVTSSFKRSTPQGDFSAENPSKKPRLHACTEGLHESLGGFFARESEEVNIRGSDVANGIAPNDTGGGQNLRNDGNIVADPANEDEDNGVGSDDLPDDFLEPLDSPLASSPPPGLHIKEPVHGHPSAADMAKLMFRQFWKAGDYDNTPSMEDLDLANGMEHVRVHPKFLHSNATSHKWALGAIAELLDNALDEAMNGATLVNVDMICNPRDGRPMLMVEDDGGGMDPDHMRQCMSLGYSAKSKMANTIGQYGNGFKTSTMRLGADVVVFSRCMSKDGSLPTQSIGLLSYTFLTATGHDDIVVPMVDYEVHPFGLKNLVRGTLDEWNKNLETILQWSPYDTEKGLFDQFKRIDGQGTVIIVYNLWEDEEGELELDFDADPHDIQLRGANRDEKNKLMASKYPNCKHFFTHKYSLRSYASILYLRLPKRFKMFLRGEQVVHHRVVSDLMLVEQVKYKPVKVSVKFYRDSVTVVTLGFVKDAKEHVDVQGFNVYYKNRLIKPFWRVWINPGIQGRGVFGVLEANFVEPAHDKQGFERTTVFARLEARLIEIQKSYWFKNCGHIGYVGNASNKKAPSKPDGARGDPSFERPPSHVPSNTRAAGSPNTTEKNKHTALVVPNEERVHAGQSIGTEKSTHTDLVVPDKKQVQMGQSTPGQSITTQKKTHMAIVVPDKAIVVPAKERVQAVQSATGQSNSSLSTEALHSQNTKNGHAIRSASHASPLSGNTGRVSSLSLAELDMEEDDQGTVVLHSSAASMPSVSRETLVPQDIIEAHSTALTSKPPDALRRVDRVKTTPSVHVTRSQALGRGRVEEVLSPLVPTVDPAQIHLAEGLSSNDNDSGLQTAHGSIDGLDVINESTLSLLAHSVATREVAEPGCAFSESDSKDTLPTMNIQACKGHLLSSNDIALSSLSSPDGYGIVHSDEPSGLHSSLAGGPVTLDASRPSPHVSFMTESLQDSNEALISPSSQCEAPESSQCTSGNAANASLTSAQTQEGRPRILTRSMLQLRQSHAKAAQQESVNTQQGNDKILQPLIDCATNAVCPTRTMPEEGDTSVTTLVADSAELTVSLDSINILEEKLDVMKQRLKSLQIDLDQIYSERDFLQGELDEERRRQSIIEEELTKKLQAVSSKARELEAANKLLQVCQR